MGEDDQNPDILRNFRGTSYSHLCNLARCNLHTAHCTLHTAHCTLYTALSSAPSTLHSEHNAQHNWPGMATFHLHISQRLNICIPQEARDHFLDTACTSLGAAGMGKGGGGQKDAKMGKRGQWKGKIGTRGKQRRGRGESSKG